MRVLEGKSIVLGVTGGIAAYKAASIASLLVQAGASVEVVMTEAAQQFVRPLTFSAITHASVHTDSFAPWHGNFTGHVSLAENADLLVIAPATAATIAKLALGLANDLISLIALSTTSPAVVAPGMEEHMLHHPATQGHLRTLTERGVTIVEPAHGRLASGAVGEGRMASPESVVAKATDVLGRSRRLAGKKFVITAGGTREPLDPIRYIGNRSSGAMGHALAAAAVAQGADVTLISAATGLRVPSGATLVNVETAAEMHHAVEQASVDADVLIMAAAVADFRPESKSRRKLKKSADMDYLDVRLVRNPDILATITRPDLLKIGFAAETEHLLENAAQKLHAKGLAMIVANDAESTIGASSSTATILTADGGITALPTMSKESLAVEIVAIVADLLGVTSSHAQ
ncbi:MAG TPA: bifunctional phosphopantothenoylcysteine decarboxylase/phosphopantothenate--cysteine ligase CoaBC [Thermomicrobiales bacterium]|nr:bifunctional phosphopantothenoylcysteine decarboxylase/phosphopantothenate--cysteine ligase CoaBC [Thermomicrobiales bacterium]